VPILRPGETCWRLARADELALLVDAHAYFEALAESLGRARHQVLILGWDLHSELRLRRDEAATLGDRLRGVASRRGGAEVYVLVWDWAVLFAAEREFLPLVNLGVRDHRRLHFHQDGRHPLGASHHQKVVVIDDAVAFCGGIDLTLRRWDTPRHEPEAPGRIDPGGEPYRPVHDVQAAVTGPAAAALGALARERWARATGETLPAPPATALPLPTATWARGVEVAISRTYPGVDGRLGIREVERLHLAAIRAARRTIYVENQYLTSAAVAGALEARLGEAEGPEVVMVVPRRSSGWLEERTMGLLRRRVLERLRAADRRGRLRVYHPRTASARGTADVFVHAKLLAVDDALLVVGSANLSNRSMGLDTECCLALESGGPGEASGLVAEVRRRLLAEHLGVGLEQVAAEEARRGSTGAAVEALRGGGGHTLEPLPHEPVAVDDLQLEASALVDPERPVQLSVIVEEAVPEARRGGSAYLRAAVWVGALVALAVAWRTTPLRSWADPARLAALVAPLADAWWGPLLSVGLFVAGSFLLVPFTLLVVHAGLLYGPALGFATALAGGLLSAAANFWLGHVAGRDLVRHLGGRRLNRVSQRLSRRGVLTVVALRLVPVAPFGVVNVVAGASHVRLRDFLIGSLVGLLPGVTALTLLGDRLAAAVRHPSLTTGAVLAAVGLALVGGLALLARLVRRIDRRAAGREG